MGAECAVLDVYLAYFSSPSDVVDVAGFLGDFPILHYFLNYGIKNTDLTLFSVLTGHTYWTTTWDVRKRNLSFSNLTCEL